MGGQRAVLRVMPDPAALSAHGISWGELSQRLSAANQVGSEQTVVQDNREIKVQVGQFLQSEQEARELVVGLPAASPSISVRWPGWRLGRDPGPAQLDGAGASSYPAVTLAIGKQPGQNAVEVAKRVEARVESLKNRLIPAGVEVTVTRDYGVTAETKSTPSSASSSLPPRRWCCWCW
jgi:multidrug efflux pump subunit AcrB